MELMTGLDELGHVARGERRRRWAPADGSLNVSGLVLPRRLWWRRTHPPGLDVGLGLCLVVGRTHREPLGPVAHGDARTPGTFQAAADAWDGPAGDAHRTVENSFNRVGVWCKGDRIEFPRRCGPALLEALLKYCGQGIVAVEELGLKGSEGLGRHKFLFDVAKQDLATRL